MTNQFLLDKHQNPYTLEVVSDNGHLFHAQVFGKRALVGEIKWSMEDSRILELTDIVIFDQPIILGRRWYERLWPFRRKSRTFRNMGLGTAMLKYVISSAEKNGAEAICGDVTPKDAENTPYLIEWYRKHGFIIRSEPYRLRNAVVSIHRTMKMSAG